MAGLPGSAGIVKPSKRLPPPEPGRREIFRSTNFISVFQTVSFCSRRIPNSSISSRSQNSNRSPGDIDRPAGRRRAPRPVIGEMETRRQPLRLATKSWTHARWPDDTFVEFDLNPLGATRTPNRPDGLLRLPIYRPVRFHIENFPEQSQFGDG